MGSVPAPRLESRLELADGRTIGLAEYGVPDGRPVLWFHGTPGGRRQMPVFGREDATERGIRLVMLERPGVGGSTAHTYDSLLGWASDVDQCADRLGLGQFAVVGLSGGGPYAMACARALPDRVVTGAVLGGVAPTQGPDAVGGGLMSLVALARPLFEPLRVPLGRVMWAGLRAAQPIGSQLFDLYVSLAPEGDQRVFRLPGMRDMFVDDLNRTGRRQYSGVITDLVMFARDWGFSPRDIIVPVHFWHGDADNIVPLAHGRHLSSLVPRSDLRVRSGESHLGFLEYCGEVFDVLLADWPGAVSTTPDTGRREVAVEQLPSRDTG